MKCSNEQRGYCLSPSGSLISIVCRFKGDEDKCEWFDANNEPQGKEKI